MPFSNMPSDCFKLWEKVYNSYKDKGMDEKEAAQRAYGAIKNAGWHKGADGKWTKKAAFAEFSMVLRDIAYNKPTNEMRWKAVASDTDEDSYGDSMSLELFNDFINRINSKEPPPEEFRSEFWNGGYPYVSISHYPDMSGDAVPGDVRKVYVDGNRFKSEGTFFDTPLGKACFRSLYEELNWTPEKSEKDPVRVSIGFLDWAHKHKSDGSTFERKSIDDICPRCVEETLMSLTQDGYERYGKIYLKGHLIHEALTRVPVNKRTSMEVDRSEADDMVTQKEDAASIIGKELAEELEEKAKLVGKSEVLVTRAAETCPKCGKEMVDGKCPECDVADDMAEEAKCKKKSETEVETVASVEGSTFTNTSIPAPAPDMTPVLSAISELKSLISSMNPVEVKSVAVSSHPLDAAITQLRSDFDAAMRLEVPVEERLKAIQESYTKVGEQIISLATPKKEEKSTSSNSNDLISALREVMTPIAQKLDLVSVQLSDLKEKPVVKSTTVVPERKSVRSQTPIVANSDFTIPQTETPSLRKMLERNYARSQGIQR